MQHSALFMKFHFNFTHKLGLAGTSPVAPHTILCCCYFVVTMPNAIKELLISQIFTRKQGWICTAIKLNSINSCPNIQTNIRVDDNTMKVYQKFTPFDKSSVFKVAVFRAPIYVDSILDHFRHLPSKSAER